MIRLMGFVTALVVAASTASSYAAQCPSARGSASSRSGWAATHERLLRSTDHKSACRALAAALIESVMARQLAATCAGAANLHPDVGALDAEINAFNELLAAKCSG